MTRATPRSAGFVIAGVLVALVLASAVSRIASTEPDGLERVAADQGLDSGETDHALAEGPFAEYTTRGVDDPGLATGIAGAIGVVTTFAVAGGIVWLVGRRRARPTGAGAAAP